jgi:RNA polymerase sigma-70 factor, ECF subfamily
MTTSTPDTRQTETDAVLVQALRSCAVGDTRALATIHAMTASRLRGQLQRLLPDRAEAEDALQECYFRIWQRAGLYDETRGRPLTWMFAIARNHAIDTLRARRATLRLDDIHAEHLIDPAAAPWVESNATTEALRRGIRTLSQEQQHCLQLAYSTGQSHEEIARGLGYPLGSVKSWIRRGLLSLRVHMQAPQG